MAAGFINLRDTYTYDSQGNLTKDVAEAYGGVSGITSFTYTDKPYTIPADVYNIYFPVQAKNLIATRTVS